MAAIGITPALKPRSPWFKELEQRRWTWEKDYSTRVHVAFYILSFNNDFIMKRTI